MESLFNDLLVSLGWGTAANTDSAKISSKPAATNEYLSVSGADGQEIADDQDGLDAMTILRDVKNVDEKALKLAALAKQELASLEKGIIAYRKTISANLLDSFDGINSVSRI